MKETTPKNYTFDEYYYLIYLPLHSKSATRRWHFAGNLFTLSWAVTFFTLALLVSAWFVLALLLTPFVVYPFAWYSHLYIEKNKPAAWTNPLWAKACDWRMCYDMLRGEIDW